MRSFASGGDLAAISNLNIAAIAPTTVACLATGTAGSCPAGAAVTSVAAIDRSGECPAASSNRSRGRVAALTTVAAIAVTTGPVPAIGVTANACATSRIHGNAMSFGTRS
jgi:hypothetical protein